MLTLEPSDSLVHGSCNQGDNCPSCAEVSAMAEHCQLQDARGNAIKSSRTRFSWAAVMTPGHSRRVRRILCTCVTSQPLAAPLLPPDRQLASMVAAWMAPVASVMASMAPIASMASMVAPLAPLVASLASMASMVVASLDRMRLMIEPKSGEERENGLSHKMCEERADGLTHKICEERVDELTHKICEERVDELTIKIDGERVGRLTHKICEERADELTVKIDGERVGRLTHIIREERVDGLIKIKIDGERVERLTRKIREERVGGLTFKIDEEGADRWSAKTGEERADGWTYRKVVEQMLVDGDGSESGGCNLAQVTPSTELQECAWVATVASMVVASMASNGGNWGLRHRGH